MSPTVALVWYLVVAAPEGGLNTMPGYFDTQEECAATVAMYQKQASAGGWSASCVPSTAPYDEGVDSGQDPGQDPDSGTGEQPAQ